MCRLMEVDMENETAASPITDGKVATSTADAAPPNAPILLEQALAAVAAKGKTRGSLSEGNVVFVFSVADLTKTIRVKSEILASRIPAYVNKHFPDDVGSRDDTAAKDGIRYLFVLENGVKAGEIPVLSLQTLNTLLPPTELTVVSETANGDQSAKIKDEPADDDATRTDSAHASQQQAQPCIDWTRAYEVFFHVMMKMPSISVKQVRLPASAMVALPVLEGLVAIAELYDCIQAISSAFKSLASDWILNRTLYSAVAATPPRWLALATKLQSDLVYKEAFVHLVGQYPNVNGPLEKIQEHVLANIVSQSRDLRMERYEVDQQLLMTTLATVRVGTTGKGGVKNGTANQHHMPIIYSTVNIWRDWIAEHLSYINSPADERNDIQCTQFCDHPASNKQSLPDCLTVAGFYHILYRGSDAYLPTEEVVKRWNKKAFGDDFASIRVNLAALKAQAQEVVAPLVRSSLQLAEKDRGALTYLTCVEVGKVPVPWAGEEDEGEDVEMDD